MRANKNERKEIEAQMKAENETAIILKKLQDSDEVTVSGRKKRKKVRLDYTRLVGNIYICIGATVGLFRRAKSGRIGRI